MSIIEKILPKDLTKLGGFLKKVNLFFVFVFGLFSLFGVSLVINKGGIINLTILIIFIVPIIVLLFNNKVISDRLEGFDRYYCNYCKDYYYAHEPRSKARDDVYCSDCGTKLDTPKKFIKGRKFEQEVKERFERSEGFKVVSETPRYEDKNTHAKKYPDLRIQYYNRDKFFVEVKYRGDGKDQKLREMITKDTQLNRFKEFKKEFGNQVYYYIGVGGSPEDPEKVFVVPIDHLVNHLKNDRDLGYLEKKNYDINFNANAFYKDGRLS